MATIKWQQKALSLSHQNDEWWVYIPYEAHGDYCTGKFSVIRDEIAYRLTCEHLFPSVPMFQLHSLLEKLKDNPDLDPRLHRKFINHLEKNKKLITDECAKNGIFMFNELRDDEGELVEYESIEYKPHLDTRDMNHWN